MISSVDKLDQQQRKDLKLRHLSDKEVAQYKQRADKGRKVSRVQVGNGKSSEGRIALDPGRRAWNPADGSQQTVQKNSRERATVSGKELAKARSGNKASPTVRDNKGSRSGVNSSPGSSARSRVQGQNSNRERSVLTSRDSTAKRTPAQSGAARQSFPPARQSQVLRNSGGNQANVGKVYRSPTPSSSVRSAQPSAQRQVYRVPSSMQHYGRQSTPRVQSNYRGSSRMQGSSRSFQRSGGSYSGRGSSGRGGGGRGGGGGGGRGGGGRGRGR